MTLFMCLWLFDLRVGVDSFLNTKSGYVLYKRKFIVSQRPLWCLVKHWTVICIMIPQWIGTKELILNAFQALRCYFVGIYWCRIKEKHCNIILNLIKIQYPWEREQLMFHSSNVHHLNWVMHGEKWVMCVKCKKIVHDQNLGLWHDYSFIVSSWRKQGIKAIDRNRWDPKIFF